MDEPDQNDPDTKMIAISHSEDPGLEEDELIIYSTAEPIKKEDS